MRRVVVALAVCSFFSIASLCHAEEDTPQKTVDCSSQSKSIRRFAFGGHPGSPTLCLEVERRPQRFLVADTDPVITTAIKAVTSGIATTQQTNRGTEVTPNTQPPESKQPIDLSTYILKMNQTIKDDLARFHALSLPPDFRISLSTSSVAAIVAEQRNANDKIHEDGIPRHISALASGTNGRVIDLTRTNTVESQSADGSHKVEKQEIPSAYIFAANDRPMVLISIGNLAASRDRKSDSSDVKANALKSRLCSNTFTRDDLERCYFQVLLARNVIGELVIAAQQTSAGTEIKDSFVSDASQVVNVNGVNLLPNDAPFSYEESQTIRIDYHHVPKGCRVYPSDPKDSIAVVLQAAPQVIDEAKWLNGVVVDTPKIYDTATLRQMLLDSESQLKAIQGFSSQPLFNAIGTFQGIQQDSSYFSAQASTTPSSSIATTNTSGLTTNNSSQVITPIAGGGTVTISCPSGMVPTAVGSTNTCTAATGASPSSATLTTIPAGTNTQTNGGTTSSGLSSTITTPQVSATIPQPISTPGLAAPSSTSLSPEDLLDKQVQLNSQVEMYRLLMRGAESDKYMTSDTRAIGLREQTTIGLTVSLNPPKQYPRAVAEVRVILVPRVGHRPPSIMTLLPEEKSYNVAKLTSHSDAFGAGVAIAPINVGVNTGRSKNRSYIARDTDTEAELLPRPPGDDNPNDADHGVWEPWWQKSGYHIRGAIRDNRLTSGCPAFRGSTRDAISFGWQFHPVFGEPYVRAGNRQVFAQLALPNDDTDNSQPLIYVQTLWREYDGKKRVMGATYVNSCSIVSSPTDIVVRNQPHIRRLTASDIGNGQVRLRAEGDFFATGISVRSANQTISPITFDGATIETFGDIQSLIRSGDLNMLTSNGHRQPFVIRQDTNKTGCSIRMLEGTAFPKPDGNADVHLELQLGSDYDLSATEDGEPTPFVMVGASIFGTLEQPFSISGAADQAHCTVATRQCNYDFAAPTSALKSSRQMVLADLTRENFRVNGELEFAPTFSAVALNEEDKSRKTKLFDITATDLKNAQFGCSDFQQGSGKFCVEPVLRANSFVTAVASIPRVGSGQDLITVANNTLAQLDVKESTLGAAKKISFDVFGKDSDQRARWTLSMAEPEKPKLSASPDYVFQNDSVPITLTGLDFSKAASVTLEGTTVATFSASDLDPNDKKSLKFTLPRNITAQKGKKTFTLKFSDKTAKDQTFDIQVAGSR